MVLYQKLTKNVILRGLKTRRFTQNPINLPRKYLKITGQFNKAMRPTYIRKRLRIFVLPTQLQIFIKISRIGFPGNQVKIFISRDSATLNESKTVFRPEKISTG